MRDLHSSISPFLLVLISSRRNAQSFFNSMRLARAIEVKLSFHGATEQTFFTLHFDSTPRHQCEGKIHHHCCTRKAITSQARERRKKKKKGEKRGTSASAKRRKGGIMEKKGATHERGRRTNFSRRGKGTEYHTGGCLEDKMLHLSHLSSRCDFIISRVVDKLHFLPAKARKINFHQ